MVTSNGIHDCSIVLFVIAERVHSAKRYRNAFEVIRQRVIDTISQAPERRRRREAVPGLVEELVAPSSCSMQQPNMPFEVDDSSYEEFSRIIQDMTGGGCLSSMSTVQGVDSGIADLVYDSGNSNLFEFTDVDYGPSVSF